MSMLAVLFIWLLNFAISWWNAYAVGCSWVETKHYGGWPRFMSWMGAIMSASGFTWCILIALMLGAWQFQFLTEKQALIGLQVGYLLVIPGILFSGFGIMVDSWAQAYRQRTLGSYGTAAYNTFAQIYNTYNAIDGIGQAFGSIFDFLGDSKSDGGGDSDDNKGAAVLLIVVLVLVALAGGVLLTTAIIKHAAGRYELPQGA